MAALDRDLGNDRSSATDGSDIPAPARNSSRKDRQLNSPYFSVSGFV